MENLFQYTIQHGPVTKNDQVYLSGADTTNEISELNKVNIFPQATGDNG